MDDLLNTMLQRQMGQQQPEQLPVVPPNPPARIPQQAKRWQNAQQIQQAYANGWSPNPILLRAMLGHR